MACGEFVNAKGVTLASLAESRRWVAWALDYQEGPDKPDSRITKIPFQRPSRGLRDRAKADTPSTWLARADAERVAAEHPKPFGDGGVGIVLGVHDGLGLAGVDLDSCRDPDTGVIELWAQAVIDRFASYAEVSPSGTGVKVFVSYDPEQEGDIHQMLGGRVDTGRQWKEFGGDHPPGIEFYFRKRYFAITGERLADSPVELMPVRLDDLRWLVNEAGPALARKPASGSAASVVSLGGGHDDSRSGRAFRLAAQMRRNGQSKDAWVAALEADDALGTWLHEKGLANGGREVERAWDRAGGDNGAPMLTEHEAALAFTERHKDDLRFDHSRGKWMVWTGSVWREDTTHRAFSYARQIAASLGEGGDKKGKGRTGSAAFAGGVERFARADPAHAVDGSEWDSDPWLLATPGGVVDLRTGRLRPARPGDMMTRSAAVTPSRGTPEKWFAFLSDVARGDAELIAFLQRWCGYCLTGDTSEHALLFGHGPGGNGKGVFCNTLAGILADYAATADMATFTASAVDKHTTDLAMLRGARLVVASETEEGRAWAEAKVKALTGGDKITARFMRQDNFTFKPQFKLTIFGNHRPVLKNVDDAMRRRMNLVPFEHKPAQPDPQLEAKLREEWPFILQWMIDGCLMWQRDGLGQPSVVREATDDYFAGEDVFGRWLADRADLDPSAAETPSAVLADVTAWCRINGETPPDARRLRSMIDRTPGLTTARTKVARLVRGLRLRPAADAFDVIKPAADVSQPGAGDRVTDGDSISVCVPMRAGAHARKGVNGEMASSPVTCHPDGLKPVDDEVYLDALVSHGEVVADRLGLLLLGPDGRFSIVGRGELARVVVTGQHVWLAPPGEARA